MESSFTPSIFLSQLQDEDGNVDYEHLLESLQQLGEHLAEDDADELEHPDIHDGDLVQALFDYEADEPEEMHLTQHEVYIFRQIDEETQWYLLEAQTSNDDGK